MSENSSIDSVSLPTPAKASWWEDFIDIFYAPSTVFARREKSGFAIPMLVVTVLTGVLFIFYSGAVQGIMDAEFARNMARAAKSNPAMTPEAMQQGQKIAGVFTRIGVFIFMPIAMFFIGLFLWLFGKIVGAKQTLGAAIMVAAYSYVPRALEALVNCVQALVLDVSGMTGRLQLSLGVGRFLDPDSSPALLGFAGRIDVFTIWVTVLLTIGLSVTGKVPMRKAAIVGVIMWFFGAAAIVLPTLRGG